MPKDDSAPQKVVSVSLPKPTLARIDARATALGLTRSAYLNLLAQHDLSNPGRFFPSSATAAAPASPPVDLTAEIYDFLLLAVQALEEYEPYCKAKREGKATGRPPVFEVEDDVANSKLWRFFLIEMDEILEYKWIQSEKAGHNIGLSRAIKEWLQGHRALWAAAHQPES